METGVKGNKSVRIVLKENTKALDEVVVVGYGTMRRSDVTGSISSVKGSELVKNSTSNVVQSLAGKCRVYRWFKIPELPVEMFLF